MAVALNLSICLFVCVYVLLAAIGALKVALHAILFVFFSHFALSFRNEFICSNRLMFVVYL